MSHTPSSRPAGVLFGAIVLVAIVLGAGTAATSAPASAPAASRRVPAVPSAPPERPAPASQPPGSAYRWPLGPAPPAVARPFDPPPEPWLSGHRGVDLAAEPGTPVRAAAAGVIRYAGQLAGRGVVSIAHVGGLRTTYEPVVPRVSVGDSVAAGAVIGILAAGHRGCRSAACLHWGLRRGETYLDPLTLLGLGRVRLLPLHRPRAAARRGAPTLRRAVPGQRLGVEAACRRSRSGSVSASRSYSSARL